jgi:hypothetical protein
MLSQIYGIFGKIPWPKFAMYLSFPNSSIISPFSFNNRIETIVLTDQNFRKCNISPERYLCISWRTSTHLKQKLYFFPFRLAQTSILAENDNRSMICQGFNDLYTSKRICNQLEITYLPRVKKPTASTPDFTFLSNIK